jgi:hypothetical protein
MSRQAWNVLTEQCFKLLDRIEDKTKIMAHQNAEIMDQLRKWQDGQLKDSYFLALLNRYYYQINKEEIEK